jgi:Raf kinase inhibitor-like YbhB/YbcL family protein
MKLIVEGIGHQRPIPEKFAFGVQDPESHIRLGENLNPAIRWQDLPEGTKSLVLICVDTDAPTRPDDVNQEGKTVPSSLPRGRFYHWVLVDLAPDLEGIAEGECSRGVTPRGKSSPPGPEGSRQGRNDYTAWFEGDKDMGGVYLGYDGPCPPWNDAIAHHYHFVLHATDLERCPVEGAFSAEDVETALTGRVLARAEVTGLYSLNPSVPAER